MMDECSIPDCDRVVDVDGYRLELHGPIYCDACHPKCSTCRRPEFLGICPRCQPDKWEAAQTRGPTKKLYVGLGPNESLGAGKRFDVPSIANATLSPEERKTFSALVRGFATWLESSDEPIGKLPAGVINLEIKNLTAGAALRARERTMNRIVDRVAFDFRERLSGLVGDRAEHSTGDGGDDSK